MIMADQTDVVIVGGGLVGPLIAVALASEGISATIIDAQKLSKRKADDFDGRSYALTLTSIRMLKVLGLWEALEAHAQPINDIKVSDGVAGQGASPLYLHFDHREIEEGPFGHLIEDRYLRRLLLDRIADEPLVKHLAGVEVLGVQNGLVRTNARKVADRELQAALVIGADGRGSKVADWAGIGRTSLDYSQTSLVCALEHELPHQGIAHQFFTPSGPLAILPLTGNRSSIVWTEARAVAEDIQARSDAGYLEALRPVFGDFLGDIKLLGKRYTYPLGLSLANSFVENRVALAGDAAHGIHPLAGQGFNLGVRDAAALTEVLVEANRRGEDIGALDVLERYQRWRRFDTAVLAVATDGINRLFSNDNPLLRGIRDAGLGLINQVPSLRRGLMREAAGLSGDMPRLLEGHRI